MQIIRDTWIPSGASYSKYATANSVPAFNCTDCAHNGVPIGLNSGERFLELPKFSQNSLLEPYS